MAGTRRRRQLLVVATVVAVVGALGWYWESSLVPGTRSVSADGFADYGGGPAAGHVHGATAGGTSVADLVADRSRPADVQVTLVARAERFRLDDGREVDGYTLNGTSPGPTIRAVQGQLVQVELVNESVRQGVSLHWHGVDVPNAEDGVAGVTQDAVPLGGRHTYRFVAVDAGTYWYHAHQDSRAEVAGGLLGALVVDPAGAAPGPEALAMLHVYAGVATVNGATGDVPVPAPDGTAVRVRVVDTDNGAARVWVGGGPFRVLAVDGTDVQGPAPVTGQSVPVAAGGRVDLEVTSPARVELGSGNALVVGSGAAPSPAPPTSVDLLSYGSPAALGFDPAAADRTFDYAIGRRPGLVDGRPGLWWTVNGHMYPDLPVFVVQLGDVVRMRISNSSGVAHPVHLHGHHAVVLSRDGVAATGSPWWVDTLDVEDGESFEIAFVADNPGIWMDHCHNLPHAEQGFVTHLAYSGVTTPYELGGPEANDPE